MLDLSSNDGFYWPKYIKALFYITLLHLKGLATHSCVKQYDDSDLSCKHKNKNYNEPSSSVAGNFLTSSSTITLVSASTLSENAYYGILQFKLGFM
jgi:hypothetical protein